MSELIAVFLVGLMGSAHCVGMCGGFVLAISHMEGGARRLQANQALYHLGKTITYAALGALAGGFGTVLGAMFSPLQDVLSIALGLFLIVVGLGLVGWTRRLDSRGVQIPGLSRAMGFVLRRGGPAGTFGLGLLNGFLPCGLVYGILALAAASGSVTQGALLMTAFGLSTIPALYLVAVAGFLLRPAWRARLNQVSGVLVILLGLATVLRGTPALDAAMALLHHG